MRTLRTPDLSSAVALAVFALAGFVAASAHAALPVFSSVYDQGTDNDASTIRGNGRVHVYFNYGASEATVPANRCTPSSGGDEICQWAVQFETTGDLVIVDVAWEGSPVEDDEPTTPSSQRSGTGGNAVTGELGSTKLATVSLVGTTGELRIQTPVGFGFVSPDGTVQTLSSPVTVAEAASLPWRSVSTQDDSACGNLGNGELSCWGDAYSGLPPAGSYRQVAAATTGACALAFDDFVSCWGSISKLGGTDYYLQIAAGTDDHMCGLLPDLSVQCWGGAFLGGGEVFSDNVYTMVSRGGAFACAITEAGSVECFGTIAAPPAVAGFVDLAGGDTHICGLLGTGEALCWGDSSDGKTTVPDPVLPPNSYEYTEISAGAAHTCGIYNAWDDMGAQTAANQAICWGDSARISGLPAGDYAALSLNDPGGCGVMTDGRIECWGVANPGDFPYPLVAAGADHNCQIDIDGELRCWGANGSGQNPGSPPTGPFVQLDANDSYNCAVKQSDGTLSCFGANGSGQSTPGGSPYTQVSTGETHACAIEPDATVTCWGDSSDGKTTPPSASDSYLVLDAGVDHTCGIKDDLSISCWGLTSDNRTAAPSTGEYVDVSLGEDWGCARRTNGAMACWGDGLSGITTPVGQFRDHAGAGASICGARSDGSPNCWGVDLPPVDFPAYQIASLSAGGQTGFTDRDHFCGSTSSGALLCVGDDYFMTDDGSDDVTDDAIDEAPLDFDMDGLEDAIDNCAAAANGPAAGTCIGGSADGLDCISDVDCTAGACSLTQDDADYDGVGDACDTCRTNADLTNFDRDGDGYGDICDNCPNVINLTQDAGACVAARLFLESGSTPLTGPQMFGAGASAAPGDHYLLKLDCPPYSLNMVDLNLGVLLPTGAISDDNGGCGMGGDGCTQNHVVFEPEKPPMDPTMFENPPNVFCPEEIGAGIVNDHALYLSMKSASGSGFCAVPGTQHTLARIDVESSSSGLAYFDFDGLSAVQACADNEAGCDTCGRNFDDQGELDSNGDPITEIVYSTAASNDADISLQLMPSAEDARNWIVELHSKVDVAGVKVGFVFNNLDGMTYGTDVEFLGCTSHESNDPAGIDDSFSCTPPGASTANGLGASVKDVYDHLGAPHTGVHLDHDAIAADTGVVWVELIGNRFTPSGDVLVEPPGGGVVEKIMLGTLRLPSSLPEPSVFASGVEFLPPGFGTPLTSIYLGHSTVSSTDIDGDLVSGDTDNCSYTFNPNQADRGGFNTSVRNGTGDVCECGDISGDGEIQLTGSPSTDDVIRLQEIMAGLIQPGTALERCSISGDTTTQTGDTPATCDIKDVVQLQLALLADESSTVQQDCSANQAKQEND